MKILIIFASKCLMFVLSYVYSKKHRYELTKNNIPEIPFTLPYWTCNYLRELCLDLPKLFSLSLRYLTTGHKNVSVFIYVRVCQSLSSRKYLHVYDCRMQCPHFLDDGERQSYFLNWSGYSYMAMRHKYLTEFKGIQILFWEAAVKKGVWWVPSVFPKWWVPSVFPKLTLQEVKRLDCIIQGW